MKGQIHFRFRKICQLQFVHGQKRLSKTEFRLKNDATVSGGEEEGRGSPDGEGANKQEE